MVLKKSQELKSWPDDLVGPNIKIPSAVGTFFTKDESSHLLVAEFACVPLPNMVYLWLRNIVGNVTLTAWIDTTGQTKSWLKEGGHQPTAEITEMMTQRCPPYMTHAD